MKDTFFHSFLMCDNFNKVPFSFVTVKNDELFKNH